VGRVVLHYMRCNNGGRRRGGGHDGVTLPLAGLYIRGGVRA